MQLTRMQGLIIPVHLHFQHIDTNGLPSAVPLLCMVVSPRYSPKQGFLQQLSADFEPPLVFRRCAAVHNIF